MAETTTEPPTTEAPTTAEPTTTAAPAAGAAALTTVNPQIVDAVKTSNTTVLGSAGAEGAAMAFQKVSQAAAFAVQDSTDYMRNVMAMSMTTQGICMKLMIEDKPNAATYNEILGYAADAVTKAQKVFSDIGTSAGDVVTNFPATKS